MVVDIGGGPLKSYYLSNGIVFTPNQSEWAATLLMKPS